jgi:succinate dehydrogenase/fumarate reductase flavoprotein subunit
MKIVTNSLTNLGSDLAFDVVVVGAGGAGMAAALFAANVGSSVLLIESQPVVGGTTAWSAGTAWLPLSQHAASVNPSDNLDNVSTYLDHAVGDQADRSLRAAFLASAAKTVSELEANSQVKFRAYPRHPDYLSDLPGSTLCGRALEPLPFDGRLLGKHFSLLRAPIPEFTVLGGMMVDRTDIAHLLSMKRSYASLRHALKLLTRHAIDRFSHPRGTRLVMGNALVGRLLASLLDQPKVSLALNTTLTRLHIEQDRVRAIVVRHENADVNITVNKRLILASGGFNRHPEKRQELLPNIELQWCVGSPGHTGQALDAAIAAGAHLDKQPGTSAFWAPVSLRKREDGSNAVFPHFVMDRAKPGVLAVNQHGKRFVNESTSYHLFGLAMQAPSYLICDARALQQYGLGMVRPGTKRLEPFLADGYLVRGTTLQELAQKLQLPANALEETVSRFNAAAAEGLDTEFQRGTTAYQRNLGDPNSVSKNPTMGALDKAPYYALRLYPGDIGACRGLVTNENGQVLDLANSPIGGLYAIGNDMQSIMGPVYPAPGITIGPALVFAYRATRDLT